MFFLKKLITFFILPPGLFIVTFGVIAYVGRRDRRVFVLSFLSGLFIYLLSIEPVKDFLLKPLETKYSQPKEVYGDVIVVLGGGSYNTGILTEDSLKRVLTGFVLHKRLNVPIILSGGSAITNLPESEAMKSVLNELGVDKSMIFTDVNSRDTLQNAFFTKKICEKYGFKSIILVTSAYHMPRSVMVFEKAGLQVIPYPTDFKMDKKYTLYSYFPKMNVLQDSTKAIREYVGIIAYKLNYLLRS
ncbi:MAG: YdcF family protein [Sulfurihydrogenibium sp.]|uniref:YdcF family protein n=1 Tax=Sulfurihydrogenibium sp. TaxID=2053621 RepID=UPI003C7E862E